MLNMDTYHVCMLKFNESIDTYQWLLLFNIHVFSNSGSCPYDIITFLLDDVPSKIFSGETIEGLS